MPVPARPVDTLVVSPAAQRTAAVTAWTYDKAETLDGTFYVTERDPRDVNWADRAAVARATELVRIGMPAELAALDGLHDSIKEMRFSTIAGCMEKDPFARLALQVLLLDGRLFSPGAGRDPGDMAHALAALASKPVAEGIDRDALVADLVQEIAEPAAINQQNHGTCTVTSLQILTALERPLDYVRIVAGLASPAGTARLPNGDTITREPGSQAATSRSHSSALWQAALMEYGDAKLGYDDKTDKHDDGTRGLSVANLANVLGALLKSPQRAVWFTEKGGTPALMANVESACAAGRRVPVSMRWSSIGAADGTNIHGMHAVLVTRFDAERVYIMNPHGSEQSLTREEFSKRIWTAIGP